MRKIIFVVLLTFILAACTANNPVESDIEENETEQDAGEILENEEPAEEAEEAEEAVDSDQASNDTESKTETPKEDESVDTSKEGETKTETSASNVTDKDGLVDLTFAIFKAQDTADYAFLESILSSGSKLNKKTNTFTFENVVYPHEQAFITEANGADLEHRYTDGDDETVIVGFAAIDYENESSYVIDFEFIMEDGSFKMNDMDINK